MPKQTEFTANQQECIDLLARVFGGRHQLNEIHAIGENTIAMPYWNALSTFDGGQLTHLVILAHEKAIRVEISAYKSELQIALYYRGKREGKIYQRHPDLETAIATYRPIPSTSKELLGRKLINKEGYTGVIAEVDEARYNPNHPTDNPWIMIVEDEIPFNKSIGCLKTLLIDWRFV